MSAINRKSIIAAALLTLAGLFAGGNAVAETATDLKCKSCVGKKDLGKKAVNSKSIRNKAVTSKKIKDGAVTTGKIGTKAVMPDNLHASAKPAGVAYASSPGPLALGGTREVALALTVTAPGPGTLVTTADFVVDYGAGSVFSCDLTTGTKSVLNDLFGQGSFYVPASLTRPIPVASAGDVTINLLCVSDGGVEIERVNMTAIFVPATY
jgi:hypothetical protein